MLRTVSAAFLVAVACALPPTLARAASYDDGLTPPDTVGSDQTYQGRSDQNGGYDDQGQGQAQGQDQGQGQYGDQGGYDQPPAARAPDYRAPAARQGGYTMAQDSTVGDLLVRIQRLEGDNRRLNGAVEDLQNQVRKLQDDIKRQQDDTEYRLQALEGGGKATAPRPAPSAPAPQRQRSGQNDQGSAAPPRSLGSLPGDGQDSVAMQQQDQTGDDPDPRPAPAPRQSRSSTIAPGLDGVAVDTSRPLPGSSGQQANLAPAGAPQTPEDEYNADYRLIEGQKYDQAESAFRNFVTAHPKDKRVPDAIHWIGESLYQRKQYTDAAEQFLKVTKTYSNSRRAPSSMLKLGITLAAMGEKDAACAALQAVSVKYPKAGPTIISGADRELKKNNCPAG